MERCVIIGSSSQNDYDHINKFIINGDYIICADGGYAICKKINLRPDLIIGDFDSGFFEIDDPRVKKIVLPREKDLTDTLTAAEHGLEMGFRDFLFLCCTGNRFDHCFANVYALEYLADNGAKGVVADEKNMILLHGGGTITLREDKNYKYISIAAIDKKITGVTYAGLKYPLSDAVLYRNLPIGVSNEFITPVATVEIKNGRALIIYSRD